MKGNPELNCDPAKGSVKAPLVLWGPYLWADGINPRKSDGLVWLREDLVESDGTHPSDSGRKKVAEMLSHFFKEDPLAKTWYREVVALARGHRGARRLQKRDRIGHNGLFDRVGTFP